MFDLSLDGFLGWEGNSGKRKLREEDFWASEAACSSLQLERSVHVGDRWWWSWDWQAGVGGFHMSGQSLWI